MKITQPVFLLIGVWTGRCASEAINHFERCYSCQKLFLSNACLRVPSVLNPHPWRRHNPFFESHNYLTTRTSGKRDLLKKKKAGLWSSHHRNFTTTILYKQSGTEAWKRARTLSMTCWNCRLARVEQDQGGTGWWDSQHHAWSIGFFVRDFLQFRRRHFLINAKFSYSKLYWCQTLQDPTVTKKPTVTRNPIEFTQSDLTKYWWAPSTNQYQSLPYY